MPNGDKGGGYFVWNETLFLDIPGADCLTVTVQPKVRWDCDRFGALSGRATIEIEGGVAPYTCSPVTNFPAPPVGTTCTAVGLTPGEDYEFSVTDSVGKLATVAVRLEKPIQIAAQVQPACPRGSITVATSGELAPFHLRWNPLLSDETGATVSGLAAGTYTVIATSSATGCFDSLQIVVPGCENPDPGPGGGIWRLGQLSVGKVYPTTVTARNASCKGKHTFQVEVEDAPWFRVTGPTTLSKIRPGKSITTEAVVDLTGIEPGELRGRILVRCLTCPPPPQCTQNMTEIEVVVNAR